ncbi:hypothetical protein ACOYR1_08390 [Thalassotalea piscium]
MEAHGTITFVWDINLLIVNLKGPFNQEGFERGFSQLKTSVLSREPGTWKRLQILDEETISSPEAIEYAMTSWNWFFDHGCVRFAIVISNSVQAYFLNDIKNPKIKVFERIEDAKVWLCQ